VVTIPDISKERDEVTGQYPDLEVSGTAAELGLQLSTQEAQDASWLLGHQKNLLAWATSAVPVFFSGKNIPLLYTVEAAKTDEFINTKVLPKLVPPVAAKLTVDGEVVTIVDAKPGQVVDVNAVAAQLASAIPMALDGETATYLRVATTEQVSEITRAQVQPLATMLDNLGSLKLTLSAEGVTLTPARKDLLTWFTVVQDDAGALALSINESAVTSYLTAKAAKTLDVNKSTTAVVSALEAAESSVNKEVQKVPTARTAALTLKPKTEVVAGSYTLNRFEGKYVEVNIKEQKMYRISGGVLEKVYRISSGKWATPTPIGTFRVAGKHLRPLSRTYNLYMPYWQNLLGTADNGDVLPLGSYGFHELPERPNGIKEGQRSLGYRASHGCVRLGIGDAEELYKWTETGTPVVIHE
jgi:lipoprotein-anchoring transpeptidase ErfK/SrfK